MRSRPQGAKLDSTICDVTDEAQISAAVEGISSRRTAVDILVNNAGILSGRSPWHTLSRADMERFIDINFLGYFLVTKAIYPLIKKTGTGRDHQRRITAHLFLGQSRANMAYVASKGAVIGMSDASSRRNAGTIRSR